MFTPTTVALLDLMQRCLRLEAIQVPPFQFRNMFKSSRCFLEARGVTFFEGTIQGHRSDTGDHYIVDDALYPPKGGGVPGQGAGLGGDRGEGGGGGGGLVE
ncbi:DUF1699 family protein [Candidatus Methanocrinis natronophilus]|uniref:DUF1699 family protein n=1 Tax=Candidatus Methanocrinis natronophilus TaxID=3033396 RepID=UPI0037443ABF